MGRLWGLLAPRPTIGTIAATWPRVAVAVVAMIVPIVDPRPRVAVAVVAMIVPIVDPIEARTDNRDDRGHVGPGVAAAIVAMIVPIVHRLEARTDNRAISATTEAAAGGRSPCRRGGAGTTS